MRRSWVLLLLAAVFSMHGVLYTPADPGAGGSAAQPVQHGKGLSFGDLVLPAPHEAVDALQVAGSGAAPIVVADAPSEGTPGHGAAGHLWTLCVAVFLAGLALLAVALAVRRATPSVVHGGMSRLHSTRGWFRLPRPPDLSSLCLLRI